MLLTLPPELLYQVTDNLLTCKDINALACTNCHLYHHLNSRLYKFGAVWKQYKPCAPIIWAIINHRPSTLRLLLGHGADILEEVHLNCYTPIYIAIFYSAGCALRTFISNGVDADPSSPLHFAIQNCTRLETLQIILEHDAKVGGTNQVDTTLLIELVSKPLVTDRKVLELLINECGPGAYELYRGLTWNVKSMGCVECCYPIGIKDR
ncbi:hypothetical protein K440DRAFT_616636 [Wilcoxina mikolae CBS 423.85]|nr:hypothetical protein K440DRAFT_616636 [Wilcoxina mikolae CBS 423.85]